MSVSSIPLLSTSPTFLREKFLRPLSSLDKRVFGFALAIFGGISLAVWTIRHYSFKKDPANLPPSGTGTSFIPPEHQPSYESSQFWNGLQAIFDQQLPEATHITLPGRGTYPKAMIGHLLSHQSEIKREEDLSTPLTIHFSDKRDVEIDGMTRMALGTMLHQERIHAQLMVYLFNCGPVDLEQDLDLKLSSIQWEQFIQLVFDPNSLTNKKELGFWLVVVNRLGFKELAERCQAEIKEYLKAPQYTEEEVVIVREIFSDTWGVDEDLKRGCSNYFEQALTKSLVVQQENAEEMNRKREGFCDVLERDTNTRRREVIIELVAQGLIEQWHESNPEENKFATDLAWHLCGVFHNFKNSLSLIYLIQAVMKQKKDAVETGLAIVRYYYTESHGLESELNQRATTVLAIMISKIADVEGFIKLDHLPERLLLLIMNHLSVEQIPLYIEGAWQRAPQIAAEKQVDSLSLFINQAHRLLHCTCRREGLIRRNKPSFVRVKRILEVVSSKIKLSQLMQNYKDKDFKVEVEALCLLQMLKTGGQEEFQQFLVQTIRRLSKEEVKTFVAMCKGKDFAEHKTRFVSEISGLAEEKDKCQEIIRLLSTK